MKIGMMGAGSIGCYVGGALAHAGEDVVFVGRAALGEELGLHGLHLVGLDGVFRHVGHPAWATTADVLSDCPVVFVAVKGVAVDEVGAELATFLRPDAVVIALQNGVSAAATLRQHLGPRAVWSCSVSFNVLRRGEGHFLRGTGGPLSVQHEFPTDLGKRLQRAGFEVARKDDIRAVLWGKLLLNLNNAINALADVPLLEEFQDRGLRRVFAAAIDEGRQVLKAEGIVPTAFIPVPLWVLVTVLRLPTWLFLRVARRIVAVDPEARSSMWEDLQRGRSTEVHLLNGEIVALGERHAIPTPVNRGIVDAIEVAEQGASVAHRVAELVALAR
ncbi:MAG: 2-dehydropantoate 2-reductase [Myxococcota bacterium]